MRIAIDMDNTIIDEMASTLIAHCLPPGKKRRRNTQYDCKNKEQAAHGVGLGGHARL